MSSERISKSNLSSKAWKFFDLLDRHAKSAECKICRKIFSYRTSVTNLLRHVRSVHNSVYLEHSEDKSDIGDDTTPSLSENEEETGENREEVDDDDSEETKALKTLESLDQAPKDEGESVCLLCQETFPDHDSGLMMDHMLQVHKISQIKLVNGSIQFEQTEDQPPKDRRKAKRSTSWDYFTAKNSKEKVAVCNLCDGELSYKSTVSNLYKHLRRKHRISPRKRAVCVVDGEEKTQNRDTPPPRRHSHRPPKGIWSFFNFVNEEKTVCACVHCDMEFNILRGGVGNMKKHLVAKHPEALLHHKTTGDPLFVSTINDDDCDESEEEHLHEEYLESDFDEHDKVKPMTSFSRSVPRRTSFERRTSFDRRTSFERKRKRPRVYQSPVFTQNNVSVSAKVPDSLEHFSNYITSLLQELPEKVSKKLQMNFVKQIIEAQISCAEKDNNSEEAATRNNNPVTGLSNGDIEVTVDGSVSDSVTSPVTAVSSDGAVTISNGIIIRPIVTTAGDYDLSQIIK